MTVRTELEQEFEFLVQCVNPTLHDGDNGQIRPLPTSEFDWDRVLELANAHGVVPLLNRTLQSQDDSRIPENVLSRLSSYTQSITLENVRLAGELHTIANAFENEGIRWLPFKGLILAEASYGDLTRRSFKDIDLLIHPEDLSQAVDILEASGFERENSLPRLDDSLVRGGPITGSLVAEYTLHRSNIEVEVRCSVGEPDLPFTPDFETLWSRRTTVEVANNKVPALSPEDRLLVLAYHGTKHNWHRLKWICDFAAAATASNIDWSMLTRQAKTHGIERKVLIGILLSEMLFDIDILRDSRHRLQTDDCSAELATQVVDRFAKGTQPRPSNTDRAIYNLKASDSPRDWLPILLSYTELRPNSLEYRFLPLPGLFHPIYYFTIPLRPVTILGNRLVETLFD